MDPISLLIWLLVAIIVLAIVWYAMGWIGVPDPPARIILLVVALILLLYLLRPVLWTI